MSNHLDGPFDKDWVGRFNFVVVSECVWSYGCTQIVCEILQLHMSTIKRPNDNCKAPKVGTIKHP